MRISANVDISYLLHVWVMCSWHSIAVEQVFSQFLVPQTLHDDERMKQLCSLYIAVDDHSKK